MTTDLSAFEPLIPERGPGEDQTITIIAIRRPAGVDGPPDVEALDAAATAHLDVLNGLFGAENVTVVSGGVDSTTTTYAPTVLNPPAP